MRSAPDGQNGESDERAATGETVYRIEAENLSKASENRIHDDTVAQLFGFSGGLVPGVAVYAYATHAMVAAWGRLWLERGFATCRFLKPVDRREAGDGDGADGGRASRDHAAERRRAVRDRRGDVASSRGGTRSPRVPWRPLPAIDARPAADEVSLAPGLWLGTPSLQTTCPMLAEYLRGCARRMRPMRPRGSSIPAWYCAFATGR